MVNSKKTQLINSTKFCPLQDLVLSKTKIFQVHIMPDEEEGFNSLVIYFFFPVLALTAILLVSLSYFFLPSYLRILISLFVLAVLLFNRFQHPQTPPPAPHPHQTKSKCRKFRAKSELIHLELENMQFHQSQSRISTSLLRHSLSSSFVAFLLPLKTSFFKLRISPKKVST